MPYVNQPTKLGETKNKNDFQTWKHSQQTPLQENHKFLGGHWIQYHPQILLQDIIQQA